MLFGIFQGISYFLTIVRYLLLAYCVLSWFMPPYRGIMKTLSRFVDPLLRPIRNVLYRFANRMPIDLSALIAFFLLELLSRLVWQVYFWIR